MIKRADSGPSEPFRVHEYKNQYGMPAAGSFFRKVVGCRPAASPKMDTLQIFLMNYSHKYKRTAQRTVHS